MPAVSQGCIADAELVGEIAADHRQCQPVRAVVKIPTEAPLRTQERPVLPCHVRVAWA